MMSKLAVAAILLAATAAANAAPAPLPSSGMLIVLPATGTVRQANDQASITMTAEEPTRTRRSRSRASTRR